MPEERADEGGGLPDPRSAEVVAATAGTPLTPGDPARLGSYTVLRRLGKGGMGVVYLARTDSWRLVAIKVIRSDVADDPAFRTRFRREAATAQKVARFCTAEVLDADPDAEQPYLVTEYVDGPNLDDAVTSTGPLAPANLERLAVGVAAALSAIHSAGVVHRDLKPANVLMSQFGPRVVDFGIARSADATRLSMDVRGMGTPAFMAPEQARGEAATPAADIFAWGGVVAFAGTGRFVFGKDEPGAVIYRAAHERPDLTGLAPQLRDLVERALSKDQADRPTASELLADLLGSPAPEQTAAVTRALHDWAPVPLGPAAAPPGEPPDDDHRGKAGGHVPQEPGHRAGWRLSKRLLALVATLGVLLAAALVIFVVLSLTSPDQAAATVTREPVLDAGPNPFLPPVGTDQRDVGSPPDSGGTHSGGTQGLYAGNPGTPSCDSARMEDLFRESPDKETAWADTLGVKQQDVSSYLQTLTSMILRTDTVVTNHRYVGNRAVPVPAVLQAGTAVLVDRFGTPVTKCYCGNPLTKPAGNVESDLRRSGMAWLLAGAGRGRPTDERPHNGFHAGGRIDGPPVQPPCPDQRWQRPARHALARRAVRATVRAPAHANRRQPGGFADRAAAARAPGDRNDARRTDTRDAWRRIRIRAGTTGDRVAAPRGVATADGAAAAAHRSASTCAAGLVADQGHRTVLEKRTSDPTRRCDRREDATEEEEADGIDRPPHRGRRAGETAVVKLLADPQRTVEQALAAFKRSVEAGPTG